MDIGKVRAQDSALRPDRNRDPGNRPERNFVHRPKLMAKYIAHGPREVAPADDSLPANFGNKWCLVTKRCRHRVFRGAFRGDFFAVDIDRQLFPFGKFFGRLADFPQSVRPLGVTVLRAVDRDLPRFDILFDDLMRRFEKIIVLVVPGQPSFFAVDQHSGLLQSVF